MVFKKRALSPVGRVGTFALEAILVLLAFCCQVMTTRADKAFGIIFTVLGNMAIVKTLTALSWFLSKLFNSKINATNSYVNWKVG